MTQQELKIFLDRKVDYYNQPSFITPDPISIPHQFAKKQDIEISGLFAALFAWGQRTTIINKANDLINRMDNAPLDFVNNHSNKDLKRLLGFKHRTFQEDDIIFLIHFLHEHYKKYDSLEDAFFVNDIGKKNTPLTLSKATNFSEQEQRLSNFYKYVFSFDHLKRTEKHISTPAKNSACKRINMYLRWMVREDNKGVDFGLWKKMKPSELMIPLDVHVIRVSQKLGLLNNDKSTWQTAVMLSEQLRKFDPIDPIKYDFALFGMGVAEKYA